MHYINQLYEHDQYMERNMNMFAHELHDISDKLVFLSQSILHESLHIDTIDEKSYRVYMQLTNNVQTMLDIFEYMAMQDRSSGRMREDMDRRRFAEKVYNHINDQFFKAPLIKGESLGKYATDSFLSTRLTKLLTCRWTIRYVEFLEGDKLQTYNDFKEAVNAYVDKLDTDQTEYYLQHSGLEVSNRT